MKRREFVSAAAALALVGPRASAAPNSLLAEISRIRIVDNHCHADPVTATRGAKWDAASPLGAPPYPAVVRLRVDNPEWVRAWRALYGYRHSDMSAEHVRALFRTKLGVMKEHGGAHPSWVLDKAGIDVALVNADSLGSGLAEPRFRLVAFADHLLSPFEMKTAPATLAEYTAKVVTPTLERWKRDRALAIKFLAAYRRSLDFAAVPEDEAKRVYEQSLSADRKALEDYLFRYIAREAGRVGLAVHIHTGNGNGPYFDNSRANPGLLEPAIGDPSMRKTTFVLIHGGWPFDKVACAMLDKPNVYADFSAQTFYLTPRAMSDVLRCWLAWQPEKVMFGSDAYSDENTPLADWEEKAWLTAAVAREALAMALGGMIGDGEVTRARALEIARLVLRQNAVRLYGL